MSCSNCGLTRREFVASSTLAAVAAVLSACGGDPVSPGGNVVPPVTGTFTVRVSDHPELSQNNRPVAINTSVAVVRTAPGVFLAFSRACTHEGTRVDVTADGFVCPNHESRFNADGSVRNGPATSALKRLAVAFDQASNTITITA